MSELRDPKELIQKLTALKAWFGKDFNRMAAIETGKWVKQNFRKQNYDGGAKWKDRAATEKGNRRAILVQKGYLRDSIRTYTQGDTVHVVSNLKYAKIHNEGGIVVQIPTDRQRAFFWAKHSESKKAKRPDADRWNALALAKVINIPIPKRQFMPLQGESLPESLVDKLVETIEKRLIEFKI